jgi:hypothetical protein
MVCGGGDGRPSREAELSDDWQVLQTGLADTGNAAGCASPQGRGVARHGVDPSILAEAKGRPAHSCRQSTAEKTNLGRSPIALRWASDQPHNN